MVTDLTQASMARQRKGGEEWNTWHEEILRGKPYKEFKIRKGHKQVRLYKIGKCSMNHEESDLETIILLV